MVGFFSSAILAEVAPGLASYIANASNSFQLILSPFLSVTDHRVAFRKKLYRRIDELQADLDAWLAEYNEARPHQGRWCYGKTPMQTFIDTLPVAKEKLMKAA